MGKDVDFSRSIDIGPVDLKEQLGHVIADPLRPTKDIEVADPQCIICGGINDAKIGWQTFCIRCAKTSWSPAVVASFIQLARQKEDHAAECEKLILELRKRIWELERNGERNESDR